MEIDTFLGTCTLQIFAHGEEAPRVAIGARVGETLSAAIWLSGQLPPVSLCNGLSLCGQCRVRYLNMAPEPTDNELEYFTPTQLLEGWRLACQHNVPNNNIDIELPSLDFEIEVKDFNGILDKGEAGNTLYLGIDLGTTTIQWRVIGADGAAIAQGSTPNPQIGAGADIISRLSYAMTDAGLMSLAKLAQNFIKDLVGSLGRANLVIQRGCIAANSAMICILLQKDIAGLASAPWSLSYQGNEIVSMGGTDFFIPPLFSPFIGSDLGAGLLYLLESDMPRPFILADLGTNAEMALLCENGQLFLASVPLGPALEGIGPVCGLPAGPGVITDFSLSYDGLVASSAFNADGISKQQQYTGIGASGYLSLISSLLRCGIMDKHGYFVKDTLMPMAAKLTANLFKIKGQPALRLSNELFLTSADVELILKVKAAFSTALRYLLDTSGISPGTISAFCLAGALGRNVKSADLEILGMIPPALGPRLKIVGNTSLEGACILALQPQKSQVIMDLRAKAQIVQLADSPLFQNDYLSAMQWGWNA